MSALLFWGLVIASWLALILGKDIPEPLWMIFGLLCLYVMSERGEEEK